MNHNTIPLRYNPIKTLLRSNYTLTKSSIQKVQHYIWSKFQRNPPTLKSPIFIIGCPRSGTSIFVKLFSQHPLVANWSEAGRVWDPVHYSDKNSDHCWDAGMATAESSIRLHSYFEWYRRRHKRPRFVNKHPRNSVRINFIKSIFPDAYFLHIIRDGRAVTNSIINKIQKDRYRQKIPFGNFCKPPNWRRYLSDNIYEQTAWQWQKIVEYILDHRSGLGDRYLEIKYEDMCKSPRIIFSDAYDFVKLPSSSQYLKSLPSRLKNMNYRYEKELTTEQIDSVVMIQKVLLSKLGYYP